jgi:tetratricopeptide (TPR) repeat protein
MPNRVALAPLLTLLVVITGAATAPPRAHAAQYRPGSVSGQVRYSPGGAPADNVTVRVEFFTGGIVAELQTDRLGKFRFMNLAAELYIVRVHAPDYLDAQQQVDLRTNASEYVLLQLTAKDSARHSTAAALPPAVLDAKTPPAARAEFEAARAALARPGRADEAIAHLEKALALYPTFVEAQMLLGTALMDKRDWARAEPALRRVLELEPKAAGARFALGELYRLQKNYAAAEAELREGLKLLPNSAEGHYALGRVYYERGDIPKAGVQVGTALRLRPDLAEGYLLAGNLLLRAHKAEEALAQFEQYLRLAPDGEYSKQAREMANKIKRALAESKRR